jgi:pre-mRNA cleavage complex 2 protein Pcf11
LYFIDLQLDVLSSVVPSAMAPSSGLSYQAEPVDNLPAAIPTLTLPLNLNELFQRLVETGIVPNLVETKKQEEEKKQEIISISFDKPESLKM